MQTAEREPVQGDTVVVDAPHSTFHGWQGTVDLLTDRDRRFAWIRVVFTDPPKGCDAGVLFATDELAVLGQ